MTGRVEPWLEQLVLNATGARGAGPWHTLQSLWSGYGEIQRVDLDGSEHPSVIVKRVAPPSPAQRWDAATRRSHERKLRSYAVEMAWYQSFAVRLGAGCRVPKALACRNDGKRWGFVLEDLDQAGYSERRSYLDPRLDAASVERCLAWLAHFHATFLGATPQRLWATGSYWHLDTRPDELRAMTRRRLRAAAHELDGRLKHAKFQSFVHGDAKIENFCFPARGTSTLEVAAVDFQYVGGGPGIRDIAYFFSSIWGSAECERHAADALSYYFAELSNALGARLTPLAAEALEQEWRSLFPVAWADFYRFLDGWAPGHAEDHAYSERMIHAALAGLGT
ncbi:MAG TPA: phosphotransferase [Polyangiaceae bacterium]